MKKPFQYTLIVLALLAAAQLCHASETDSESLIAALNQLQPPPAESLPQEITFKEARTYPFRRYPKKFNGFITVSAYKLIVKYTFPSSYEIELGPEGAFLDQGNGKMQDLGNPPGLSLLKDLLQWDVSAIAEHWVLVEESISGGQTTLHLKPIEKATKEAISGLTIIFDSHRVYAVRVDEVGGITREYNFEADAAAGSKS